MKRILIAFIALISFTASYAQDINTFTDEDNTFSVEYPASWKSNADKYGGATSVDFSSPKKNAKGRPEAITAFRMGPLEKGQTFDAVMKSQLTGLKKELHVSQFTENRKVNGKHILVCSPKIDGTVMKMKMICWEHNKKLCIFTFITAAKTYPAYEQEADAMVSSFKFL